MNEPNNEPVSKRTRLINVAHVKEYALHCSQEYRNGKFSRVSEEFIDKLDAEIRCLVAARVKAHPSIGVTLR